MSEDSGWSPLHSLAPRQTEAGEGPAEEDGEQHAGEHGAVDQQADGPVGRERVAILGGRRDGLGCRAQGMEGTLKKILWTATLMERRQSNSIWPVACAVNVPYGFIHQNLG